jgi:hypothetical protein
LLSVPHVAGDNPQVTPPFFESFATLTVNETVEPAGKVVEAGEAIVTFTALPPPPQAVNNVRRIKAKRVMATQYLRMGLLCTTNSQK